MWCHSWSPIQLFFIWKKKIWQKERKIHSFLQSLLGWFIDFFFSGNKVTIKRHRKLLRILIRKFSFVIFVRKIFFDSRWGEYINQVWVSNVDFSSILISSFIYTSVDSKRNRVCLKNFAQRFCKTEQTMKFSFRF